MTYSTESVADKCTVHYYRNLLNMRNVKGKITNAYRPYKLLYHTILDAICVCMFLNYFNLTDIDNDIQMPEGFTDMTNEEKIGWINKISDEILEEFSVANVTYLIA